MISWSSIFIVLVTSYPDRVRIFNILVAKSWSLWSLTSSLRLQSDKYVDIIDRLWGFMSTQWLNRRKNLIEVGRHVLVVSWNLTKILRLVQLLRLRRYHFPDSFKARSLGDCTIKNVECRKVGHSVNEYRYSTVPMGWVTDIPGYFMSPRLLTPEFFNYPEVLVFQIFL